MVPVPLVVVLGWLLALAVLTAAWFGCDRRRLVAEVRDLRRRLDDERAADRMHPSVRPGRASGLDVAESRVWDETVARQGESPEPGTYPLREWMASWPQPAPDSDGGQP